MAHRNHTEKTSRNVQPPVSVWDDVDMTDRDESEDPHREDPHNDTFGTASGGFHTPAWNSIEPPRRTPSPVPLRPLGILETITSAFSVIKFNLPVMLGIPLVIQLIVGVVTLLVSGPDGGTVELAIAPDGSLVAPEVNGGDIANSIVTLLIALVLTVTATVATLNALYGRKISVGRAFSEALADAPRLLLAMATYILLGVGLLTIAVFALSLIPGVTNSPIVLFGFLVAVFYLSVRLSCVIPSLVAEATGPFQAVSRSWSLTRGYASFAAGPILIVLIGFIVAIMLASPALAVIYEVASVPVGSAVVSALSTAVVNAVSAMIYVNLRMHKEDFHYQISSYQD